MVKLLYAIERPEDWQGSWPPKIAEIGVYIGMRFNGKPLSEAAMRYRHKMLKRHWNIQRGELSDSKD